MMKIATNLSEESLKELFQKVLPLIVDNFLVNLKKAKISDNDFKMKFELNFASLVS